MRLITVLVVDDDAEIRFLTQLALETSTNWTVLTAAGGADGVAIAQRSRLDVILLDMMMPDVDGVAALTRHRGTPSTRDVPVIMFTAKPSHPHRAVPWVGLEVAGVVEKPYDPLTLSERIEEMMGWR